MKMDHQKNTVDLINPRTMKRDLRKNSLISKVEKGPIPKVKKHPIPKVKNDLTGNKVERQVKDIRREIEYIFAVQYI